MMPLLIYIAKASACMVVLYGFYKLALQSEKTLQFNRFYLVAALVASLTFPALNATVYLPAFLSSAQPEQITSTAFDPSILANPAFYEAAMVEESLVDPVNWSAILWIVYLSIAGMFFIRFAINIGKIIYMIFKSDQLTEHGVRYVMVDDTDGLPYSFLHFVFVCKAEFLEGRMPNEVLAHEKAHSEQLHTLDILIVELVRIVFWFHPFLFLFKRAIQLNHEYLADSVVLQQCDVAGYQKTLLDFTFQRHSLTLVSNFNYSFTKKRLIMMTKLRTSRLRLSGKIALLLPVLFAAFLISANCQTQDPPEKEKKEAIIEKKVLNAEEAKALKEATEAQKQAKVKMVIAKENNADALNELEEAKEEVEAQKKVIKMKKIELDKDSEDLEGELEKLMEELSEDLEGMEIDLDELLENIQEGNNIDVEEIVDGVTKRIKVVSPGLNEDFEHEMDLEFLKDIDIDIDIEGLEEIEKLIEMKHLDGGHKKVIFIGEDGEHIEVKDGGQEKVIIINGEDGEVIELKDGVQKQKIMIINGDDDGEKIWINKDGHGDIEKEIKVIIKECDEDSKSKKKKRK